MKKTTAPTKLSLKHETVKALQVNDLKQILGGLTAAPPCNQPTTTVHHTFDC